jgi:hypothetical protein
MTLKSPHIGRRTAEPSRLSGAATGLNAHRMVAEVAVSMAEEYFETFAADNAFYRAIRAQGQITEKAARLVFVERVAPRLLEDARRALTDCLTMGDDVMPKRQKDEIAAALILDTDLRANRFVAEENATIPSVLH